MGRSWWLLVRTETLARNLYYRFLDVGDAFLVWKKLANFFYRNLIYVELPAINFGLFQISRRRELRDNQPSERSIIEQHRLASFTRRSIHLKNISNSM